MLFKSCFLQRSLLVLLHALLFSPMFTFRTSSTLTKKESQNVQPLRHTLQLKTLRVEQEYLLLHSYPKFPTIKHNQSHIISFTSILIASNHHKMLKITILILSLFLHSSSVICHESLRILTLHHGGSSYTAPIYTIGVSVDEQKLNEVSHSILMAENWLRTHVLSYYPSININSVIVFNNFLCDREDAVRLTVDSMKNLHHSLTRWGLEREIKVSVSLSSNCLRHSHLQPVFSLLEKINSTYTVNVAQFSDEIAKMLTSELKLMNDLDVFRSETVNVILPTLKQAKFRKLSFIDNLWSTATPPPPEVFHISPAPEIQPPMMTPASSPSHPYGYSLPPCNPYPHRHGHGHHAVPPVAGNYGVPVAAPPMVGKVGEEKVWCVAKPSVPSEKLQVALDYACGAGGADCGPIRPNGSCFSPDSVVAHASYAFNSYWQKNKRNGGVCGFEGTAMLISSDPSYLHCRFILG